MTGVALSSLTFWLVFKLSFFYLDIGPMNRKDLYVREISKAQTCILVLFAKGSTKHCHCSKSHEIAVDRF